jgi:hypothetical protein
VDSQTKRRVLTAVAAVAVTVQIVGVFSPYYVGVKGARRLSGVPVYTFGVSPADRAPYGNEGPAWVPSISPLRFQSLVLAAWIKEKVTGTGFVATYSPFLGSSGRADLRHPSASLGLALPDDWWTAPGGSPWVSGIGVALGLLALASALGLAGVVRVGGDSRLRWAPAALPTG